MKYLSIVATVIILAPALAMGQGQTGGQTAAPTTDIQQDQQKIQETKQDIQKDRQEIKTDRGQMQALDAQHADAVKDLNAKEKAAIQAVKDDKTLAPAQRKAKLADIRKDLNGQRKDINQKFREDRHKLQDDIKKDRQDIRKDRRQLNAERRDLHHDARRGGGRK